MGYVETLMGENERILVKTRQHWIVLAGAFFTNFVFSIIIVVAAVAAMMVFPPAGLVILLLLVPAAIFLRSYIDWWNEEYLITNRRVVQAEGFINKHVIDSSLEKVNDVVLNQSLAGRLLDFGDMEILTASEIGVNKLHTIAAPVKFKTAMLNAKAELGDDEHFGHTPHAEHDVPALIAELDELRKQGVLTETEFQEKKAQLLSKM